MMFKSHFSLMFNVHTETQIAIPLFSMLLFLNIVYAVFRYVKMNHNIYVCVCYTINL